MAYEVELQQSVDVPESLGAAVLAAVTATLDYAQAEPAAALSLLLGDDEQVKELNQRFRNLAGSTDVLSFPAGAGLGPVAPELEAYLGDIIISVPYARSNANAAGHSLEAELQLLAIHGTLHLLGHDHTEESDKEEMWSVQASVLSQLGLDHIAP